VGGLGGSGLSVMTASRLKIHPPQQVLEARVVAEVMVGNLYIRGALEEANRPDASPLRLAYEITSGRLRRRLFRRHLRIAPAVVWPRLP